LARSTNLFESLGSTTVICSIDREGTISSVRINNIQGFFPLCKIMFNFLIIK